MEYDLPNQSQNDAWISVSDVCRIVIHQLQFVMTKRAKSRRQIAEMMNAAVTSTTFDNRLEIQFKTLLH